MNGEEREERGHCSVNDGFWRVASILDAVHGRFRVMAGKLVTLEAAESVTPCVASSCLQRQGLSDVRFVVE